MIRPMALLLVPAVIVTSGACSSTPPTLPGNDPPSVTITSPSAGSFDVYQPVTFSGTATDLQDGTNCCLTTFTWIVLDAGIRYSSFPLGTGQSLMTDSLPISDVRVRLTVADLDGNTTSRNASFVVVLGKELLFDTGVGELRRIVGRSDSLVVVGDNPAWSPDGSRIAFQRDDGNDLEIFLVNPDGSNLVQVTGNGANNFKPTWSPDGTRLAYTSDFAGNQDIWIIDLMSGATTPVTTHAARDDEADWSGTVIVFMSERDGDGDKEIFIVNDDLSTAPMQLTFNAVEDRDPQWSPSGSQIVFSRDAGNSEIWIMNAAGGGPTNLTNHPAKDTEAQMAPDGMKIAFISDRTSSNRVWIMRSNGSRPLEVHDVRSNDASHPRWKP